MTAFFQPYDSASEVLADAAIPFKRAQQLCDFIGETSYNLLSNPTDFTVRNSVVLLSTLVNPSRSAGVYLFLWGAECYLTLFSRSIASMIDCAKNPMQYFSEQNNEPELRIG